MLGGVSACALAVAVDQRDEPEIFGAGGKVATHLAQVLRSCLREWPCFVDAAEYREQRRPSKVGRSRGEALAYLFECVQCLVGRTRAENERQVEPRRIRRGVTREPGVVELLLGGFGVLVVLHSHVRAVGEQAPQQPDPTRIATLLLQWQCRAAKLLGLSDAGRTVAAVDA